MEKKRRRGKERRRGRGREAKRKGRPIRYGTMTINMNTCFGFMEQPWIRISSIDFSRVSS